MTDMLKFIQFKVVELKLKYHKEKIDSIFAFSFFYFYFTIDKMMHFKYKQMFSIVLIYLYFLVIK